LLEERKSKYPSKPSHSGHEGSHKMIQRSIEARLEFRTCDRDSLAARGLLLYARAQTALTFADVLSTVAENPNMLQRPLNDVHRVQG
jgi:hypothetical protein